MCASRREHFEHPRMSPDPSAAAVWSCVPLMLSAPDPSPQMFTAGTSAGLGKGFQEPEPRVARISEDSTKFYSPQIEGDFELVSGSMTSVCGGM